MGIRLGQSKFGKTGRARWRPKAAGGVGRNKTEQSLANYFERLKRSGEIVDYADKPIKLRIGDDFKTTWSPDFMVLRASGEIEFADAKGGGGWEEHTRVKIKAAARLFPMFHFVAYHLQRGGEFEIERF